jgi:hypothetical protein
VPVDEYFEFPKSSQTVTKTKALTMDELSEKILYFKNARLIHKDVFQFFGE